MRHGGTRQRVVGPKGSKTSRNHTYCCSQNSTTSNEQQCTLRLKSKHFHLERGTKQGNPLSTLWSNSLVQHILKPLAGKWKRYNHGAQKLQSLQDKKNYVKDACACEEEVPKLNEEMEERKARFQARVQALSEKSGDCGRAAAALEEEIQTRQGRKEEAAVRRNPIDVALIRPCYLGRWSRSSHAEQHRQNTHPSHAGRVLQKVQGSSRFGANGRRRREGRLGRRFG